MTAADRPMVLLHLDTGHVVGATALDGATTPTVAALTGGSHVALRVRSGRVVPVPAVLLALRETGYDRDVLLAPAAFRVVDQPPGVSWVGGPAEGAATVGLGPPWQACLTLWHGDDGRPAEVVREQLDGEGKLPAVAPPGTTHRLVAVPGRPLRFSP